MEPSQAAEHLQEIRTLMERSAIYRRALAPIMTYCGVVGILGATIGNFLPRNTAREFVLYWTTVAVVALTGSILLVRRQALKDSEPFWSPPTRRVLQALAPPFAVGAFCSSVWLSFPARDLDILSLIPIWCILFGLAVYSAAFFMPRGMKFFGCLFILIGCSLFRFGWALPYSPWPIFRLPDLLMGGIFGGLHLAYGIYLYLTEKRGNES